MMKLLTALAVAVLLAGCSLSPPLVVTPPTAPHLVAPSQTALADCFGPIVLPKGSATQQQVEIGWEVDDDHLLDCAARHKILANYIRKRDAGLAGTK